MSGAQPALIPIYTSKGDSEAFLRYPYLFNRTGDWIGFVTANREVYSVLGNYVGILTNDPRIVGKRNAATLRPHMQPPPKPPKVHPAAIVPLAPLMPDLEYAAIDILLEAPERLHTIDSGEEREDLD